MCYLTKAVYLTASILSLLAFAYVLYRGDRKRKRIQRDLARATQKAQKAQQARK